MCTHIYSNTPHHLTCTHTHRYWLKASISLTVVMGITWIIGFLVIEVEELFTLAYIFTICVAFQGLFIFVIFVVLSKQVRENYGKWWKAKVAESDFLSKHFGDKTLRTGLVSEISVVVSLHVQPMCTIIRFCLYVAMYIIVASLIPKPGPFTSLTVL